MCRLAIFLKEILCLPVWQDANEKIFLGAHFNTCIWASGCLNNFTSTIIMMITSRNNPYFLKIKSWPNSQILSNIIRICFSLNRLLRRSKAFRASRKDANICVCVCVCSTLFWIVVNYSDTILKLCVCLFTSCAHLVSKRDFVVYY